MPLIWNSTTNTWQNDLVTQQTASFAAGSALGQPYSRQDLFGVGLVAQKSSVVELKPNYGLSILRDNITVNGATYTSGAYADEVNGEIQLASTATANDSIILESAQRGVYIAGRSAELGIGVRVPVLPVGTQELRWGLFDNTNGFYFGVDATGLFVAIRRSGIVTKIYQSSWNGDKANGAGASGLSLNLAQGSIFQIVFNWYGFGPIHFIANINDANGVGRLVTLHRFTPSSQTSVIDPNLPIRAEIANGSTATAINLYVAGRQYSILGLLQPQTRITSEYVFGIATSPTILPILSFRRKSTFRGRSNTVSCSVLGMDASAKGQDNFVQLRVGGTIGGGTWGTPSDYGATETCLESNIAPTSLTGGSPLSSVIIAAGTRTVERVAGTRFTLPVALPAGLPITLMARTTTGNGTLNVLLHMEEYW